MSGLSQLLLAENSADWGDGTLVTVGSRTYLKREAATQMIGAASWTAISWDTETYDDLNAWASGSPTLIVVPTGITRARIVSYVTWTSSSSGDRYHQIEYDGGPVALESRAAKNESASTLTHMMPVTAGKNIIIKVNQTSTGSINLPTSATWPGPCRVQVEWFA
jgi:hypothetical protein